MSRPQEFVTTYETSPRPTAELAPQAIILAAGRGKRLGSKSDTIPKCLLEVGGATLLEHQLTMFAAAGITDVCVVAGYQQELVKQACQGSAHVILNEDWSKTNSLYSLSLAKEWVNRNVVVVNCDVLVEPIAIKRLMHSPVSQFAIDKSSGDDDEHMKVQVADGCLVAMNKSLDSSSVHGENVGILHFSAEDAELLFDCAAEALADGGDGQWMAAAVELLARQRCLRPMDISHLAWIEIDFAEDLDHARKTVWPLIERRRREKAESSVHNLFGD